MRIEADAGQRAAILGALQAVAETPDAGAVTPADRATLAAAARIVLGAPLPETPRAVSPAELAATLGGGPLAAEALRLATVMALVDGRLDRARIDRVVAFAAALGIDEDYVGDLARAAHGQLQWAMGHMIRANMESITNRPWRAGVTDAVAAWLLPYDSRPEPALAARFEALGTLPEGSFGRALWRHFRDNGYALPGQPGGLNARFSLPHDGAHVLSGYDTSSAGEILVSTFTAALHPANAMAAHVLPVVMTWHLGLQFNPVARFDRGQLDPARFFEAWERGAATRVDLFADGWDFWAVAGRDLEILRRDYGIAPAKE